MVDLHCHILPGIDDGAKDEKVTSSLLFEELNNGVSKVVFTPHYYYEKIDLKEFLIRREEAFNKAKRIISAESLPLELKTGAEIFFTPALAKLPLKHLALGETRYVLVEFPTKFCPAGIEETFETVMARGYIPVIAHIERYDFLTNDPLRVYDMVASGVLVQANAKTFAHAGEGAKILKRYLKWNMLHFVASDAHDMEHRNIRIKAALDTLSKEDAEKLVSYSEALFAGSKIETNPIMPKKFLGRWK